MSVSGIAVSNLLRGRPYIWWLFDSVQEVSFISNFSFSFCGIKMVDSATSHFLYIMPTDYGASSVSDFCIPWEENWKGS